MPLPPLSLYIHLPWCVRKCPYCDFNSHERSGALPEAAYLSALLADLEQELPDVQQREITSIFFGGGTPSLLSPDFYHRLLSTLAQRLTLAPDCEITLEANPGTVEQDRFNGFRQAGINRLSIGVQSFHDGHLRALGRIHGGAEALRAAEQARRAGFDNLNLDLMHALPGQSPDEALADLRQAIALAPTHISWYELTIEPNTAFFRAPPVQPDGDSMADTEAAGFALLSAAGYGRYEVSAFARAGQQCRHNLNYWAFGDYLALGAGGHGKVTRDTPEGRQLVRYRKTRMPADYLAEGGTARRGTAIVATDELAGEFMMNALRLVNGVNAATFSARTGLPLSTLAAPLDKARQQGLLVDHPDQLMCTPLGLAHLNHTISLFMPGH
ncbi:radical SAM family heme chaperone HemW [Alcanivorax sp. JB21]|uniref:radical SAM family heme chaperone HemW n=1 Tax=Alcanivorax limicola TaxID=2874102 RepID=UPI001CC09F6F|nr:radical SAM family heme chaperone HemW [Alcanivorax limicola]MBZ2188803.1 radical SAM family heme chaperone HemW [Alcanivorax limicola]